MEIDCGGDDWLDWPEDDDDDYQEVLLVIIKNN